MTRDKLIEIIRNNDLRWVTDSVSRIDAEKLADSIMSEIAASEDDDQTLHQRDFCHEWADKLADAIAEHFAVDIGEHSSSNSPWQEALDAIQSSAIDRLTNADRDTPIPETIYRWSALDYRGYCYGSRPPKNLPARCNITAFVRPFKAARYAPAELVANSKRLIAEHKSCLGAFRIALNEFSIALDRASAELERIDGSDWKESA